MSTATSPARAALDDSVDDGTVGDHLGSTEEAPGLVTERFACLLPGYRGWYWAVSASVLDDQVTINDIVLLPGDEAIVAPAWTPYRERVRPGDLGPGDVLPPEEDDIRLVPAWSDGDGDETGVVDRHFAREIGLGREWVLSIEGREDAAERWYEGESGPDTPIAKQAPGVCGTCGFLVSLAGDLSDRFGVCANKMANADGRVVALTHGCGAHSGTRPKRSASASKLPDPVLDSTRAELEEF
ncbi:MULTISPECIES: DUF3027 domain-containing protein [Aeromicrobium]|uniref:DUF3027 domain-containing protein n=1 Tax=Aeromicrobium TaxID=2040 RepID=UPI0025800A2C|nr:MULTISPECIES: DUF3027 domain-containing protein [Aeromicrobium]